MIDSTPRWKQCSDLIVLGSCRKEIATKLGVTTKTVDYHLAKAKSKMGLKGAGDAPFFLAAVDRTRLDKIEKRLTLIEKHLKLALDILIEMRGH